MLFHNVEGPQAPKKCEIPQASNICRRLLESDVSQERQVFLVPVSILMSLKCVSLMSWQWEMRVLLVLTDWNREKLYFVSIHDN